MPQSVLRGSVISYYFLVCAQNISESTPGGRGHILPYAFVLFDFSVTLRYCLFRKVNTINKRLNFDLVSFCFPLFVFLFLLHSHVLFL